MTTIIKPSKWLSLKKQKLEPNVMQLEAFEEIRNHYNGKDPVPGLISAYMGTGKCELIVEAALSIILAPGEIVCISTTTLEIVDDLKKIFKKLSHEVGVVHNSSDSIKPITIICDRSAHRLIEENIKFLIVDEAHHSECESFLNFVDAVDPEFILGLTATPFRADDTSYLSLFEKVIYRYDSGRALRDKIIVPWKLIAYSRVGKTQKQRDEIDVQMAIAFEGKGVINSSSIKDANRFNRILQKRGVKSKVLHSGLTNSERKKVKLDFVHGDTKVIVYVDMLKEGVNYPFLRWAILRRKVDSRIRFIQEIGRLIRSDKNKTHCKICDPHALFNKFQISYDEAISSSESLAESYHRMTSKQRFYHLLSHPYEFQFEAESAIVNISSILKAYGLKMTRDRYAGMKRLTDTILHQEFKQLSKGHKPKNWRYLLTEIDKAFLAMKRSYGLEINKMLNKIQLLGFWPTLDSNKIITLTEEQQDKITIVNIMRFKPHFWKGKYYSQIELCKMFNMSRATFVKRLKRGDDLETILLAPLTNNIKINIDEVIGQTYGAVTILKLDKEGKGIHNSKFICRCKCSNIISRTYQAIKNNKGCYCKMTKPRYENKRAALMKEADLVGKTVKGYLFTDKEKRTTSPGKYEWVFYGHCVSCGRPIKISKYELKKRPEGCDHKLRKPMGRFTDSHHILAK